jgi:transcriptional regulator with XRE-family HTH domain
MLTHAELLAEMMTNPAVKAECECLNASEEFFLLDLVSARRQSGLSIETLAARLGIEPAAAKQLEFSFLNGKRSPTLATLRKYVEACSKKLELRVVRG